MNKTLPAHFIISFIFFISLVSWSGVECQNMHLILNINLK